MLTVNALSGQPNLLLRHVLLERPPSGPWVLFSENSSRLGSPRFTATVATLSPVPSPAQREVEARSDAQGLRPETSPDSLSGALELAHDSSDQPGSTSRILLPGISLAPVVVRALIEGARAGSPCEPDFFGFEPSSAPRPRAVLAPLFRHLPGPCVHLGLPDVVQEVR